MKPFCEFFMMQIYYHIFDASGVSSPPRLQHFRKVMRETLVDKGMSTSARYHGLYSRLAHIGASEAADCLCVTDCRVSGAARVCALKSRHRHN